MRASFPNQSTNGSSKSYIICDKRAAYFKYFMFLPSKKEPSQSRQD